MAGVGGGGVGCPHERRALALAWSTDEGPDSAAGRLARDFQPPGQEVAEWYSALLRAARWARPAESVLQVRDPRIIGFDVDTVTEGSFLSLQVAVAPVHTGELPAGWRPAPLRFGPPDIEPQPDGATSHFTIMNVNRAIDLARLPAPIAAAAVTPAALREPLAAIVAELDALARQALSTFAAP